MRNRFAVFDLYTVRDWDLYKGFDCYIRFAVSCFNKTLYNVITKTCSCNLGKKVLRLEDISDNSHFSSL